MMSYTLFKATIEKPEEIYTEEITHSDMSIPVEYMSHLTRDEMIAALVDGEKVGDAGRVFIDVTSNIKRAHNWFNDPELVTEYQERIMKHVRIHTSPNLKKNPFQKERYYVEFNGQIPWYLNIEDLEQRERASS